MVHLQLVGKVIRMSKQRLRQLHARSKVTLACILGDNVPSKAT